MRTRAFQERRPRRIKGLAMIALITLIAMVSAYFMASAMNRTTAEVNNVRAERATDVMQQAKASLIAYAARYDTTGANLQPGALPCPDLDDDGIAEDRGAGSCVSTYSCCDVPAERIGRFPWKTVGAPDLRDGSGERLWYALSGNFRYAPGITVLNSDTAGDLTVTGTSPATNAIAVLFAPGNSVGGQSRDSTSSTSWNNAANFLEGVNAGTTGTYITTAQPSDTFNDRLIAVTQGELMTMVEPVVAARMQEKITTELNSYAATSQWGSYPFPTAFNTAGDGPGTSATRPQSSYTGSSALAASGYGLLPMATPSSYAWASGTGTVSKVSGTGTISGAPSCAVYLTVKFRCTVVLTNTSNGTMTMTIGVSAQVPNVGQALVKYTTYSGSTGSSSDFIPSTVASSWVSGTGVTVQASPAASLSVSLLNTGSAQVDYSVTVRYSVTNCPANCRQRSTTITLPVYPPAIYAHPLLSAPYTDTDYGWFRTNEWYRLFFYAVAPSQLPGGNDNCSTTANAANCLSITGLSGTTSTAYKQAILLLMGRAIPNVNSPSTRPTSNMNGYLETGQTPASRTYTNRQGVATSINDRIVVVN